MPLKVYETIGTLNRFMTAMIDGREVPVQFINGTRSPRLIRGHYSTGNKKIQKWLEESDGFNVRYRLTRSIPIPGETQIIEVEDGEPILPPHADDDKATGEKTPNVPDDVDDIAAIEKPKEVDKGVHEDVHEEKTEVIVVGDEVPNGQQARNYLLHNYKDLTFRDLKNNDMIIAKAKSLGVQFTSWEAFVNTK